MPGQTFYLVLSQDQFQGDIRLLTATQATTFRPDALSARYPQLVVLDLLYVAVAQRTH